MSFLAYYFHWSLGAALDLPHLEREKFCKEIGRINREAAGGPENNLFRP